MSKESRQSLDARLKNPTQKIEWALKLLIEKGHKIGERLEGDGARMQFDVDGQMRSVPEIYTAASRYPEWNDRLGLGTATLRRITN